MTYKDYPANPLYDEVPDAYWTEGYCAIFAFALHERFGLSMRAMIAKSTDGEETMIHTVGVMPDGRLVDAKGLRSANDFGYEGWTPEEFAATVFRPVEQVRVEFEEVDLERLLELSPEDVEATNAAHAFIDKHPELFVDVFENNVQRVPTREHSFGCSM